MKWFKQTAPLLLGGFFLFTGNFAQAETLTEAIAEMMQSNPEVKAQSYNRLARDQEVVQARSGWLPRLDLMLGAGYEDVQEPVEGEFNPVEARLSLRQNIFAGMSTNNEIDRQKARVRSAAYNLRWTTENTALKGARAYLDVLRHQELNALAVENLINHQRIGDQIQLRSQSGVGNQVDSEQVQGRLALARSNVVVTETNLIDAKSGFRAVFGRMPGDLLRPEIPAGTMPVSLEEAEAWAVESHPVLQSATADLTARYKQRDVANNGYLPIVDLELDQNWSDEVDGVDEKQQSTVAMIRLRYNLFNGLKDQGRKAETVQLIEEAREIRNNSQRQVIESINLSWMAHQSIEQRRQYILDQVDATQATAAAFTKQFDLGRRTLLDVLDTEAEAVNARRDLINIVYDGLYSQFRVLTGTGRLIPTLGLQWPEESLVEDAEADKEVQADKGKAGKEQASTRRIHLQELEMYSQSLSMLE